MKMRKRWITIIAACVLAAGTAGCANPQKSGVDALEAGNYEEALADFQDMTESGSKDDVAEGYRGLGMTYYEKEDYENALDAFKQAADNGAKQTIEMYNLMGICAMQTGDYAAALDYIQSGIALTSTSDGTDSADAGLIQEMKYNEIICCENLADWESAKKKVTEYLESYTDDETMQKESEFLETR